MTIQEKVKQYISEGKTQAEAINMAYDEKPKMQSGGTWEQQQERVRRETASKPFPKLSVADLIAEKRLRDQNIGRELPPQIQRDNTRVNTNIRPELISKVARNKTDKEIADERKYVREQDAKSPINTDFFNPNIHTRENWATGSKGLESQFRVSDEPNFFDDYLNPVNMIGGMGASLGSAPLRAQQEDSYMPYITAIGAPLAVGAMAGIGASSNAQFVNNLANPLAGTGDLVNNLGNKYLPNAYKLNPRAFKPNSDSFYRQIDNTTYNEGLESGLIRGKQDINMTSGEGIININKAFGDDAYYNKGSLYYKDNKDLPYLFEANLGEDRFIPKVNGRKRKYTTENTSVRVSKEPISINDPSITTYQKDWLKGYKQIEVPNKANPLVENTIQPITSKPWKMEELSGLHLQSTMENGAISKIIEPKTGLINTEQALAIIGKESGGSDKIALIKQGLGENIPKKMDYNEFRKVTQEQLIPLESNLVEHASNYGLPSLGYPASKRSVYEPAIQNAKNSIEDITTQLKNLNSKSNLSPGDIGHKQNLEGLLKGHLENIKTHQKTIENAPLENKTIVFGNKEKFGKGSNAHNNPDETLGHAHFLRDVETPDVLTVTQIQSDAFQGTHRIMPKIFDSEKGKYVLNRAEEIQKRNKSVLDRMKTEGVDEAGRPIYEHDIKQMQQIADAQEQSNILQKGHVQNFTQKSLLDKNHQERYIQELVDYAGKRGDLSKVRVPTSETAANVQGYGQLIQTGDNAPGFAKLQEEISIAVRQGNQEKVNELMKVHDKMLNTPYKSYNTEHQTILKKYSEQPKLIKKLFGKEPTLVTDNKGNTWYEFDIPDKAKKGKMEIKAFSTVGVVGASYLATQGQKEVPIKQQGGTIEYTQDELNFLEELKKLSF